MSARPYTAIPNTQIYKNNSVSLVKRPLSADTVFCNDKKCSDDTFSKMDSDNFCELLPTKDCISDVNNLPSSQILKSLLSEAVDRPWKMKEKCLERSPSFDACSVDSLNESEKSLGKKIQEVAQRNVTEPGVLIPGIKTKPPLPEKSKKKFENLHTIHLDIFPQIENEDVFDFLGDEKTFERDSLINNVFPVNAANAESLQLNGQCFLEDLEDTEKPVPLNLVNTEDKLFSQYKNEENISDTSFKNWLQENNNLILETKILERQTDIDLQNLHKQQEELNESIYNISPLFSYDDKEVSTNKITSESIVENRKTSSLNNSAEPCLPNKNKMHDTAEKTNKVSRNNRSSSNKTNLTVRNNDKSVKEPSVSKKKLPKSILKAKIKKPIANVNNIKNDEISKKSTEKSQMRQSPSIDENVKTWVSKNTKQESFLEFLNKLDDLENISECEGKEITLEDTYMQDLPEHDAEKHLSSTCDEIATILEVLEQEDLKSQKSIESLKEIVNNELSDSAQLKNCETRSVSSSSLTSSSNYNEFLSYLDEVDQNCTKTLKTANDRIRAVKKVTNAVLNIETVPKLEDLLNYSNVELAHYVVDLSLRLKEKKSGVSTLQIELSKLRGLLNAKAEEFDRTMKLKLRAQKDDYEAVIKRHQKFIDQLIADKKSLNQQCEGLISEMKVLEDRYNTNAKAVEQRHKIELQKAKEMHMAAEKLRRDKWIEGKTQKIKEMTVKSLEPELQNMQTRHQQELSDLRSLHKRELEDLELRAARKTQQQCEALRQQLTTEREAAIAHEREILRQRLEKLVESEEKGYQEQRRRLNAEHAARLTECEEKVAAMANERDRAKEATRLEYEDKFQTALRRHKTELKNFRESTDLEFEVWKNNFKKQQSIKLAEIETQMREACKKERDREIEMVIERLEQEASETKEQTEHAAENRLRRIKEKFEEEIKDLEKIVDDYKSKYSETKEKLLYHEDTVINMKTTMKQLQSQLQQAKAVTEELTMDRNKMREQIKEEFMSEISCLENEIKLLKSSKEEEMQKIFAKVKVTVARKDGLLTELSHNNENLQEKCTLLENLLEQQRKEYLIK